MSGFGRMGSFDAFAALPYQDRLQFARLVRAPGRPLVAEDVWFTFDFKVFRR